MHKVAFLILVTFLFGFQTTKYDWNIGCESLLKEHNVQNGFSYHNVLNVLGSPSFKDKSLDGCARWYYVSSIAVLKLFFPKIYKQNIAIVEFDFNNQVVDIKFIEKLGISRYNHKATKFCDARDTYFQNLMRRYIKEHKKVSK